MSEQVNQIVRLLLIPVIEAIFKSYEDEPTNITKPTSHFSQKMYEKDSETDRFKFHDFELVQDSYNKQYKLADIEDVDFSVILTINSKCLTLSISPNDNFENNQNQSYFAFSPTQTMYSYGVKANGNGPRMSGNVLNNLMFLVCQAMHIPQIYISDSAGVSCYYDSDVEIKHFSILRVIAGKPTFYSSLRGHFLSPTAAQDNINLLRSNLSEVKKEKVRKYLASVAQNDTNGITAMCDELNEIIDDSLSLLPLEPAMFKYVATPYIVSLRGGQSKKKRKLRRYRSKKQRVVK